MRSAGGPERQSIWLDLVGYVALALSGALFALQAALTPRRPETAAEDLSLAPPAAVKVPSGAFQDIYDAWAGALAYEPADMRAPVAIIRGEWDGMCTDADASWLLDALRAAPIRRDVKIGHATHLMYLETNRCALYRETEASLSARDAAPC